VRAVVAGEGQVQGVCAAGNELWLSVSFGSSPHAILYRVVGHPHLSVDVDAPSLGESLTYAPSSDHLWTCTEISQPSVVYCVNRSDLTHL
jgi:hypothetical protein